MSHIMPIATIPAINAIASLILLPPLRALSVYGNIPVQCSPHMSPCILSLFAYQQTLRCLYPFFTSCRLYDGQLWNVNVISASASAVHCHCGIGGNRHACQMVVLHILGKCCILCAICRSVYVQLRTPRSRCACPCASPVDIICACHLASQRCDRA